MARMTDESRREVFLLTASLLPDATPFLAAFEKVLHRLITPRPRLVDWLRWIDRQAASSKAAYGRCSAIYYALAFTRAHVLAHARTRTSALDRTLGVPLALDRVFALDRALALIGTLDRAMALSRDFDPRPRQSRRPSTLSRLDTNKTLSSPSTATAVVS